MKNDLDFIRDKIENSGVRAPEDMNEQYVAKMTENVAPKLDVAKQEKPKRKGWKIALSATAAVLVAVIALTIILHVVGGSGVRNITFPSGLALKQFSSYDQIRDEVSRLRKAQEKGDFWDNLKGISRALGNDLYMEESGSSSKDYAASDSETGSSGAASSQSHSETYEQVSGVNEADIIKTDGKYIYCVDSYNMGEIAIFSAQGKDSRRVATIDVAKQSAATEDEADFDYYSYYGYGPDVDEIYLRYDRLIVLSVDWEDSCEHTTVQVYDVSDINNIALLDSMSQSGNYSSSRMIGDTLYTVSSYYPYENKVMPVCGRGEQPDGIPAECIYTLAGNDTDSFLVLSAYDTVDFTAQTESKSILGGVDDIYCNENHMYIYSTVWDDANRADDWSGSYNVSTQILKVDLTDGLGFTAYASVKGQVDDQYALDEYDGNLRIATTTYDYLDGNDSNHLFVLDDSLNVIGSVNGFAENESIKAVRYMGDTAYVITYEQTDPLFVIDLSAPTAPAILGEVKISGFSTMLVRIDENTLLGIGYHTEDEDYTTLEVQEGLKLALFDVSDKANPKVLDSKSYLYCDSMVQYNPKALVYNPDRDDFIIPLNYSNWGHYDSAKQEYVYVDDYYGGVLNFRVDGGKLNEISRYKTDYDAVDRCAYVGDTIYMTHYEDDGLEIDSVKYK